MSSSAKIDREYDAFMARVAEQEAAAMQPPKQKPEKLGVAGGIAGVWMLIALVSFAVSIVFDGLFPYWFVGTLFTMPIAIICMVIHMKPQNVRHGLVVFLPPRG